MVGASKLDVVVIGAGAAGLAGRVRSMVEAVWTHDWEHGPFARGAYSYSRVDGMEAPAALARPIRRMLFFAGEASDAEGAAGTVHGAIASGRHAAKQVIQTLS